MDRWETGGGVSVQSNIKTILELKESMIYLVDVCSVSLNGCSVEVKPRKKVPVVVCSGTKDYEKQW